MLIGFRNTFTYAHIASDLPRSFTCHFKFPDDVFCPSQYKTRRPNGLSECRVDNSLIHRQRNQYRQQQTSLYILSLNDEKSKTRHNNQLFHNVVLCIVNVTLAHINHREGNKKGKEEEEEKEEEKSDYSSDIDGRSLTNYAVHRVAPSKLPRGVRLFVVINLFRFDC